jgi:hypothetical protein
MSERWVVPILVAVVGLASALGGAYLGGRAANKGQQKQFENQRTAQLQDLLIATYSNFVRAAATASVGPASPSQTREVFAAEAQVEFVGDAGVKKAARDLRRKALSNPPSGVFRQTEQSFVHAAVASINSQ